MGSLILGTDGKVHTGEVVRKFGATLMQANCDAEPMRPVGDRERWWKRDAWRACPKCGTDELQSAQT